MMGRGAGKKKAIPCTKELTGAVAIFTGHAQDWGHQHFILDERVTCEVRLHSSLRDHWQLTVAKGGSVVFFGGIATKKLPLLL